jgi:hemolysin III
VKPAAKNLNNLPIERIEMSNTKTKRTYSTKEEIANAITHGIGALLAIAALVILVVFAAIKGNVWHVVSFSVYGSTLVLLYFASTLYHSLTNLRAKGVFHKFDHISIYLLIAGTYTPFCLTALRGWIGWTVLGIVWSCAILGAVLKSISVGKRVMMSTILYVLMGWVILIAIKPLYNSMPYNGFLLLIAGGVSYTIGTIFFIRDKVKYNHSVWHLFVLGGSVLHFFSVLTLLSVGKS